MLNARKLLLTVITGGALLATPSIAAAATINVDTGGDGAAGCTLRNAIDSADTNASVGTCTAGTGDDTVVVPGTIASPIALNSQLDAGGLGALTVNGPGAGALTVNGGAAFRVLQVNGAVSINGLTLANGHATTDGLGGGIFLQSGSLTLDHVVVSGNQASLTATAGTTSVFGGGIYANGPLTLVDSTVSGNTAAATNSGTTVADVAAATGGGVFATGAFAVTVNRSTIAGNEVTATAPAGSGGSLAAAGGLFASPANTVTVDLSTISENTVQALGHPAALTTGGGIFSLAAGTTLTSDTLTENSAQNGANLAGSATMTIRNTLVTAPGVGANCNGAKTSGGFNLESAVPPAGSTCGFTQPTDKLVHPADTGLDPDLRSNGGPTPTHALLDLTPLGAPSPATDAGFSFGATTDQRGFTRPVDFLGVPNAAGSDGSDIGAFEIQKACPGQFTPGGPCTPAIRANPTSLIFGSADVGTTSGELTTTVSNFGGVDLHIDTVTIGGSDAGDFAISSDSCSSATLIPGGVCSIGVEFTPTADGARLATLIIPSDDPTRPSLPVGLRGDGVGAAVVPPPSTQPPPGVVQPPTGKTGKRAKAKKRCKKKFPKGPKRKKCLKKAKRLPV